MTSRREFLEHGAAAALGLSLPIGVAIKRTAPPPPSFLDLRHAPDLVVAQTDTGETRLLSVTAGRWESGDIIVRLLDQPGATRVQLSSPTTSVKRIHLRWRGNIDATRLILGDAWERGYGDLEWRAFVPDRAPVSSESKSSRQPGV